VADGNGFFHPGVLLNQAQLDAMRTRSLGGIEPQATAYKALLAEPLAALTYPPHPWAAVICGSSSASPDSECADEKADSEAAFAQALLWNITGNHVYAQNAMNIMNAWATKFTGGHSGSNSPLQSGWVGTAWARAAEIIRYSNAGWSAANIATFSNMLKTQYLPYLLPTNCSNGNWELSMTDAEINIAVFLDDRTTFNAALTKWRGRAPAYIYLKTDGAAPKLPPGCGMPAWLTTAYVDGLLQETYRDPGHANYGFAAMVNAAETARQQGVDLYNEQGTRIMAAMEFQAQYLPPNHGTPPSGASFALEKTWEIAYNHYHNRLGLSLPLMGAVIPGNRPTGLDHHEEWETMTHGEMGAIGLPPITQP
jgi:hypothetical protein